MMVNFVSETLLSWWMVGVKAVLLREDTRGQLKRCGKTCNSSVDCWGRQILLIGNKLKCCFPVGSFPNIESDINWRLDCKLYHACKLVTVVYLSLNNLRQFLSRVLWYLTNTANVKKTGLEGVPYSPTAEKWRVVGLKTRSWSLSMSWTNGCSPTAGWATSMLGFWKRNLWYFNLVKTFCFWGVSKSTYMFTVHALLFLLYYTAYKSLLARVWLTSPQDFL